MAEPLCIAVSCISSLNGIATLSKQPVGFVDVVQGARKDVEAFSKELQSLRDTVSRPSDTRIHMQEVVKEDVVSILEQYKAVINLLPTYWAYAQMD